MKAGIEPLAGEYSDNRHQMKDAKDDVYRLAYHLHVCDATTSKANGRTSDLRTPAFAAKRIASMAEHIEKFNAMQYVVEEEHPEDITGEQDGDSPNYDDCLADEDMAALAELLGNED